MPARNTVKQYDAPAYYHVYNRGIDARTLFKDDEDYSVFLNILKRHLDTEPTFDSSGRQYERFDDIELIAFCLMPNHFHMLIYQDSPEAMTRLMRKVATAYSVYFNRKYRRSGRLFQGPYRAKKITSESYFLHITRYIHLNPKDYLGWEWSSLDVFLGYRNFLWVHPGKVMSMSREQYLTYLEDYTDYAKSLKDLRSELADG